MSWLGIRKDLDHNIVFHECEVKKIVDLARELKSQADRACLRLLGSRRGYDVVQGIGNYYQILDVDDPIVIQVRSGGVRRPEL